MLQQHYSMKQNINIPIPALFITISISPACFAALTQASVSAKSAAIISHFSISSRNDSKSFLVREIATIVAPALLKAIAIALPIDLPF